MTFLRTNSRYGVLCLVIALLFVASCNNTPDLRVVTFEVTTDRGGVAQPVGGEEFRLLKGNYIDLLGGNSKDPNGASKLSDVTVLMRDSGASPEERTRVNQPFQTHSLALAKTDAQGKAKFPAVLPGNYWVVGWTRVGENQLMIWNYPVEIKKNDSEKQQHVVLNSANAAATVPYTPRAQR